MASTTTIVFVTPDNQQTVFDRINPQTGGKQASIDRIAAYLTAMANGSQKKTSMTITIGGLPVVNL